MGMGPPGPPVGGGGGSRKWTVGLLAAGGAAIVVMLILISVALVRGRTGSVEPTQTVVAQAPASNTPVPATNTLVPSTQTPYILVVTATPAPPLPTTTRTPTIPGASAAATVARVSQQNPTQTAQAAASSAPASAVPTATTVPPTAVPPTQTPLPQSTPYVPGGDGYAGPEKGAVEDRGGGWHRIRQAANEAYLPWTAEFQLTVVGYPSVQGFAQWDSPTRLQLTNPTDKPVVVKLSIRRDQGAPGECNCDPYAQAFGTGNGGWFIGGGQGSVIVNGAAPVALKGLGFYQMAFPRDWKGVWNLEITINPGATITVNQGVIKPGAQDTWKLP